PFLWQVSLLVKQKKLESKINIRKDKDMITNYKKFWQNSFNYKGKATRKEYWLVALMNALIGFGLGLAIGLAGALNASETIIGCLIGVLIVYCFVVLVPSLSLSVRRLRDAGFHWAFIFFYFVPTIGSLVLLVLYCLPTKESIEDKQVQEETR
ncbi:TPA: DUF805 domain-containing protein, partial [Enterococcus faecium]